MIAVFAAAGGDQGYSVAFADLPFVPHLVARGTTRLAPNVAAKLHAAAQYPRKLIFGAHIEHIPCSEDQQTIVITLQHVITPLLPPKRDCLRGAVENVPEQQRYLDLWS